MTSKRRAVWVGVDVGFSRHRASTGLCAVNAAGRLVALEHLRAAELPKRLENLLSKFEVRAAAIDGPLIPGSKPGIWRKLKVYRDCEKILSTGLCQRSIKPGQTNSGTGQKLHAVATRTARLFGGIPVYEAFPNAFLGALLEGRDLKAPRGGKSDAYWERCLRRGILQHLVRSTFWPTLAAELTRISNHDERASLVCAITARLGPRGSAVGGPDGHGAIMLPPRRYLRPWIAAHLASRCQSA